MSKKPSAVKFSAAYKNNLPLFSHTPPYSFLFVLQQIIKTEYSKISTPPDIKYRKRLRLHPKIVSNGNPPYFLISYESSCSDGLMSPKNRLAILSLEIGHKFHQRGHAFYRHGVINAGAHTAQRFIAFQLA